MAENRFLIGLIVIFIGITSCSKEYDYPKEPVLSYKNFFYVSNESGEVTHGILVLEFTDGDGDIGLGQEDTLPPYHVDGDYYYNFFIDLYTKEGGNYVKVEYPDPSFSFHSRIPPILFSGKSKAIKGELEYTFDLLIMKPFLESDTIMIETYIVDRALNHSNVVRTPDIPLL